MNLKKNIKNWNYLEYAKKYEDLKSISNDPSKLLTHAIENGIKENREFIFDDKFEFPINVIKEKSKLLLPEDFYWKTYISLHEDVKNLSESDAEFHYIYHGVNENRSYNYSDKNLKKLSWQVPNKTEQECYEKLNNFDLSNVNYVAIPWANIIEYMHEHDNNIKKTLHYFGYDINKLISKDKLNITTFQSYHIMSSKFPEYKFINDLKSININVIFSPHITKEYSIKFFKEKQILILPILLYPIIDPELDIKYREKYIESLNKEDKEISMLVDHYNKQDKNYDISFIGNIKYNQSQEEGIRCQKVRTEIVDVLKNIDNTYIKTLTSWHLNNEIYGKQLNKLKYSELKNIEQILNEINYFYNMKNSKFILCPIGIGPNSIRLSETIIFEKTPIIISDDIWLPREDIFNKCCITIKENAINNIEKLTKSFNFNKNHLLDAKKYLSDLSNPIKEFINDEKYVLITQLYFATGEKKNELDYVCKKNIENSLIKKIVIFFEIIEENTNYKEKIYDEFPYLKNNKIDIIFKIKKEKRTISMNEMLEYINNKYIGSKIILTNNDIYFDNTLSLIKKSELLKNNEIVCLTRTNVFNIIKNDGNIWEKHEKTQDSWIFMSPVKIPPCTLNLGWIISDNLLCGWFHNLGYTLSNPTEYINGFHYQNQHDTLNQQTLGYKHNENKYESVSVSFTKVHEPSICKKIWNK